MANTDEWTFIVNFAKAQGVPYETRKSWRRRGVPQKWRLPIVEHAREMGIEFDIEVFDKPPAAQAAA